LDKKPEIKELPSNIFSLFFKEGHKVNQENLDKLLADVSETLKRYLEQEQEVLSTKPPALRLSQVGTKPRLFWYQWNFSQRPELFGSISVEEESKDDATVMMRFFLGSILELFLLFLIREAGYEVTGEQEEVELDGVLGHPDCFINGELVDIKTASPFGFDKFRYGGIFEVNGDEYGYLYQISSYKEAKNYKGPVHFLAFNKSTGQIVLLEVPEYHLPDPRKKIKELRDIAELPEPPAEKCWPEKIHSNGNKQIDKKCTWCKFKDICWQSSNGGTGLRAFKYARGVEYFSHIEKLPNVEEVT
jgi:hypothetical protein